MATQTLNFPWKAGGTGLTLRIISLTNGSIVASASASDLASNRGVQSASFTDVAAATYLVQLLNGTTIYASDFYTLTLTTGVFWPIDTASSGDASQTTLLAVKAKTDLIGTGQGIVDLVASAVLNTGTIVGFPTSLIIGDSYVDINVDILDEDENPLTSIDGNSLDDADTVSFTAFRVGDSSDLHITGTCTYSAVSGSRVTISIPSSETSIGKAGYTYEGRLKFVWETEDAQKTFKTTQFTFEYNP